MEKNSTGDDQKAAATDNKSTASVVPTETVELDTPIMRGSKKVTHIDLRKPLVGALRGVTLVDVLNMDVQALTKVIPRISDPALTENDIRNLDPADLVQLGTVVTNFLLAKRFRDTES